jgi:cytochrome o ubiquinol oxidase subunit 1
MDRYLGTVFFERLWRQLDDVRQPDLDLGPPEVYMILPLFGVSEVVSTFSGKRLFGYASMVYATLVITILSMSWLHHFFTMGSGRA